ncbi:type II toxin-antitoxin system death-on-curing family toxin [Alphaproteobacteria bacterium]|nr:type II toxin-antitoxin system death-on-curing family toxin [Alphaproteobacteria bacterium]
MANFLSLAEVLAIHTDQIEKYGGSHGIRDPGQLESALFRPQSGYYDDANQQAAAVWESLSQNHPFIDGNKRTAFAVTYTFLLINHIVITADANQIWQFLSKNYESGQMRYEVLCAWLQQNTRQI